MPRFFFTVTDTRSAHEVSQAAHMARLVYGQAPAVGLDDSQRVFCDPI